MSKPPGKCLAGRISSQPGNANQALGRRPRLGGADKELLLRTEDHVSKRREEKQRNPAARYGELGRDERGIVAAEAEGIAHGDLDLCLARGVGYVVEIALRIGLLEIDGPARFRV